MEDFLKTFSVGFLLRSVFSGVFFVLSFSTATQGLDKTLMNVSSLNDVTPILALALIAGVSIYGLHRSLIYPVFEWAFNATWAQKWRGNWFTLISENSIKKLKEKWKERSAYQSTEESEISSSAAAHMEAWADYVHLQFTSTWCIAFGALIAAIPGKEYPSWCWPLISLGGIFVLAAIISNWRLHSVEQYRAGNIPLPPKITSHR